MQTDKYTKVILTLIAIGLFLNLAMYLRVTPAGAASDFLEANLVRTGRLEIVNADGETVIAAGTKAGFGDGLLTVSNNSGQDVIIAGADIEGDGRLRVINNSGQTVIAAGSDWKNDGSFAVSNNSGKRIIYAGADGLSANGQFAVLDKSGKGMIYAGVNSDKTGGYINVENKTGQSVVTLSVDDYGNGEVGAWNRKGKGRVWGSQ